MDLPISFQDKMKKILQEEYSDYITSYEEPMNQGLRVNTKKITCEEFEKIAPFSLKKIPWIQNGYYYYNETVKPSKHPYYYAGLYYLQEPSAMTPAGRLFIEEDDYVLDLCAAPGGKATELGARLGPNGLLVANDISNSRAKGLLKNIELFGIPNTLVVSETPEKLAACFPVYFDKILVDAPCSGEGMFRREPSMVKSWLEHGPDYYAPLQKEIIMKAASMLRPGGMMLYSTCTFSVEENEEVIAHLLREDECFELLAIDSYEGFSKGYRITGQNRTANYKDTKKHSNSRDFENEQWMEQLEKCVRIWPHKMNGEGHFMALLHKKEDQNTFYRNQYYNPAGTQASRKNVQLEPIIEFMKDVSIDFDLNRLEIHNEQVYLLPNGLPPIKRLRFLRTGLYLGDVKTKRFEPSQALAMVMHKEEYVSYIDFEVEDSRVIKYLKGETLEVDDLVTTKSKGWQLICVSGYPLGWGKLVNGTLRNKYYAGWRWQ